MPSSRAPCERCSHPCERADRVAMDMAHGSRDSFRAALTEGSSQLAARLCYCERVLDGFDRLRADDRCSPPELTMGQVLTLSTLRDVLVDQAASVPVRDQPILLVPLPGDPAYLSAELVRRFVESAGFPVAYRVLDTALAVGHELKRGGYAALVIAGSGGVTDAARRDRLKAVCRVAKSTCGIGLPTSYYSRGDTPFDALRGLDHHCSSAGLLPDYLNSLFHSLH
ncbi:MAG: hypothetical protein AAFU65_01155 [Pseudomonadota bacterium]